MHETMGQIIKRLRKERGLTQESLAERLGVTFQAVSKWETDAGMPDVSQIVPLANAFGVRTDVLFGLEGRDEGGEVQEIIRSAYRLIDGPDDRDGLLRCYQALLEGLKRYPCQPALLCRRWRPAHRWPIPKTRAMTAKTAGESTLNASSMRLWSSDTPEAPPTFCARICCWCCCMRRMAIRKPQRSTRSSSRCGRI